MSAINGTGYGSMHSWEYRATIGRTTYYDCDCGAAFAHNYNETPNIFEAIKKAGVPETCLLKVRCSSTE